MLKMIIIIVLLIILYLRFFTNKRIEHFAACGVNWKCWKKKSDEYEKQAKTEAGNANYWKGQYDSQWWAWFNADNLLKAANTKITSQCTNMKKLNNIEWNPSEENIPGLPSVDNAVARASEIAAMRSGWAGYPEGEEWTKAGGLGDPRGDVKQTIEQCRSYARQQGYSGVGYRTPMTLAAQPAYWHNTCFFFTTPDDVPNGDGFIGKDNHFVTCTDPAKSWGECGTQSQSWISFKNKDNKRGNFTMRRRRRRRRGVSEAAGSENTATEAARTQQISVRQVNGDCSNIVDVITDIIAAIPQLLNRSITGPIDALIELYADALEDVAKLPGLVTQVTQQAQDATNFCTEIKTINNINWGKDKDGNSIEITDIDQECTNVGGVFGEILVAVPDILNNQLIKLGELIAICDKIKMINEQGTPLENGKISWGPDRDGKTMEVEKVDEDCGNLIDAIASISLVVGRLLEYHKDVPDLLNQARHDAINGICTSVTDPITDHINKNYDDGEINTPRTTPLPASTDNPLSIKDLMDGNMCANTPTILFMLLDIQFERAKAEICALIIGPIDKEIDSNDWSKGERTRNYPESNWGGLTDALKGRGFTEELYNKGGGRYGKDRGGDSKRGFSINDFRGLAPDGTDKGPGPDTCDNIGPIVLIMLAIYMDRGIAEGKKLVCAMVSGWNTINWEQEKLPGLGSFGFKNEWLRIPDATDGDTTNAGVVLEEDCSNLPAYILSLLKLIPGLLEKLIKIAVDKAMEVITGPICNAVTTLLEGDVDGENPLKISPHPGDLGLLDGKVRDEMDKVTYRDPTKKDPKWKVEGMNGNCGNLVEFVIQLLKRIGNFITELPGIIEAAIMVEINKIFSKITDITTSLLDKTGIELKEPINRYVNYNNS